MRPQSSFGCLELAQPALAFGCRRRATWPRWHVSGRCVRRTTKPRPSARCCPSMHAAGPPQLARTPHVRGGMPRSCASAAAQRTSAGAALALRALLLAAACAAAHAQQLPRPGGASGGNRGAPIGIGVAVLVVIVACCVGCCFHRQLRAWWERVRPRPVRTAAMAGPTQAAFVPYGVSGTVVTAAPVAVLVVPNPSTASPASEAAGAQNPSGAWVPRDAAAQ